MDIQADVGHVVKVLAGHQPDDLADLAFGIVSRHTGKCFRADLLILCKFRYIVQCCAFRVGKERARRVLIQSIKLRLILSLIHI